MLSPPVAPADSGPGIRPDDDRWHASWARVAVALVLAGQGMSFGLAANISPPSGHTYWWLHGGLFLSAVVVILLLGGPLLRECWSTLWAGRITVDQLFLLSLFGAMAASVFSTVRGTGPIFYELVAVLLSIYTVGKLLGARSRARVLASIDDIRSEFDTCLVLRPAGAESVRAADVAVGDRVLVRAGDRFAVDGRIISGEGLVATTPLTGEPEPRLLQTGEFVYAGMTSVDGGFTIEATAAPGERRLDEILGQIEQARLRPSQLQSLADRVASRFVPVVALVAIATFAGWWVGGRGASTAVENGLAVLVVACPCALGLATPLGIWAGLARLGRIGIVARSGDFLDGLATADVALFDKTGTLCEPDLTLAGCEVLASSPLDEETLRAVVAKAESGVDHPVAAALRSAFGSELQDRFALRESRVIPGRGIRAVVVDTESDYAYEILAGSHLLMRQANVALPAEVEASPESGSMRTLFVAIDGSVAARLTLAERLREEVAAVFAQLQNFGIEVEILTGDPGYSAGRWPEISCQTGLTPLQKAERVRELKGGSHTILFVGDGLNDGPALAEADVALAIREGSQLARSNAAGVIAGSSIGSLPQAIALARRVRSAIVSNLRFAALYNTIGMGVAAAGWLHPVLAALLMAGSSALVSFRVVHRAKARG